MCGCSCLTLIFLLPPIPHSLQAIKYHVPVSLAMKSTGATCTYREINGRIARYKARMGEIIQSISPSIPPACNKSVPVGQNSPPACDASIPTTVMPARPLAIMVSGKKRSCEQLGKKCVVDVVTRAREAALDKIPEWLDKTKTAAVMSKQIKSPTGSIEAIRGVISAPNHRAYVHTGPLVNRGEVK